MFERHISTIQMVLPFLTPRSKNMKSSMAPAMTIMIRFHFIVLKTLTQNQDFVEKLIEMCLTITQVLTLFLLDLGMKGTIPLKSKTKFLLMELILKHFSIIQFQTRFQQSAQRCIKSLKFQLITILQTGIWVMSLSKFSKKSINFELTLKTGETLTL